MASLITIGSHFLSAQPRQDADRKGKTFEQKQREALGLPFEGPQNAALYLSLSTNKGTVGQPGYYIFDDDFTPPDDSRDITGLMHEIIEKNEPNILKSVKMAIPSPCWLNVIYVPPIDANGKRLGDCSTSSPYTLKQNLLASHNSEYSAHELKSPVPDNN